jgi:AGZA family xanthine/uracil permease-like MFS transporter
MMPFTYSITNGIGAGLVTYTVIKAGRGRWREVHYPLWIATAVFAVYFALHPIKELLGIG